MAGKILIIEDESAIVSMLTRFLSSRGYEIVSASNGLDGIAAFERHSPDITLLDFMMPGMDGFSVLRALKASAPDALVIMVTAHADVSTSVEAMKAGAENFLAKPINLEYLDTLLQKLFEKLELTRRDQLTRMQDRDASQFTALGNSPGIGELITMARLLAENESTPALILGESGTGKGFLASLIHRNSRRSSQQFVTVNCASLTATFLESELFGHEKGAFTDAKFQKRGLVEYAKGGTIFLDEIGDLPLELQPKLLHFLEERTFRRLGGTQELRADVRFIFATNKPLEDEVSAKRFRADLYYRIAVMPLYVPPLREHPDDVPFIASGLLADLANRFGKTGVEISQAGLAAMKGYPWPGNVRELRNVLERGLILSGGGTILPEHLPAEIRRAASGASTPAPDLEFSSASLSLEEMERQYILSVLARNGDNRSKTARDLQIARTTLLDKLKKYGVEN